MANVQRQFEQFHDAIKLGHYDENAELREKRDRVLHHLENGLQRLFADKGEKPPVFESFDQGSYAMGTGVKPLDSDYDIDEGLRFKIAKNDHRDPVVVKEWVYRALEGHTQRVEVRRPCVTVYYQERDEPVYHVDLAVYSDGSCNSDGKIYLAKGKLNSDENHRFWEEADPQGLIACIKNHFQDSEDAAQFRRTIRYLKRWKDVKFPHRGNAAPIGIGVTVAAYYWFAPEKIVNTFDNTRRYDDLASLQRFVRAMLGHFRPVYSNGAWVERLQVPLPVAPRTDLFEKMTDTQMADFKAKLEKLLDAIEAAREMVDPVEACTLLRGQFGDDFPVPPKEETARRSAPAIISSSSSA